MLCVTPAEQSEAFYLEESMTVDLYLNFAEDNQGWHKLLCLCDHFTSGNGIQWLLILTKIWA